MKVRINHARTNALDVSVRYCGEDHVVMYVGSGHPIHTITDKGGRVATKTEAALAEALALECQHSARLLANLEGVLSDRLASPPNQPTDARANPKTGGVA